MSKDSWFIQNIVGSKDPLYELMSLVEPFEPMLAEPLACITEWESQTLCSIDRVGFLHEIWRNVAFVYILLENLLEPSFFVPIDWVFDRFFM